MHKGGIKYGLYFLLSSCNEFYNYIGIKWVGGMPII